MENIIVLKKTSTHEYKGAVMQVKLRLSAREMPIYSKSTCNSFILSHLESAKNNTTSETNIDEFIDICNKMTYKFNASKLMDLRLEITGRADITAGDNIIFEI